MKIRTASYNHAEELLGPHATRLVQLMSSVPLPSYPGKSSAKNGSKYRFLQTVLNPLIAELLKREGWVLEPAYCKKKRHFSDAYRVLDGNRTFIEAELANSARTSADFLKFQAAFCQHHTLDVGIQISLCAETAKLTDSNIAVFEKSVSDMDWLGSAITAPVLLIGLSHEGAQEFDMRELGYPLSDFKGNGSQKKSEALAHDWIAGNLPWSKLAA